MKKNDQYYPWINDKAIEFLQNFLEQNKDAKILEFGSGGSTIWFSHRTKNLISVEHDKNWFDFINENLFKNINCNSVDMRLIEKDYYKINKEFCDEYFDLILVDGINRLKCIEATIRILKQGGILMLDNAERSCYKKVNFILDDWKIYKTEQLRPNISNDENRIRQTNWWIKPYFKI